MNGSVSIEAARAALSSATEPYVQPLTHGTMRCVLFAPRGEDVQTPHRQDELYVVTRGSGTLLRASEHVPVGLGDALFVPAGMEHRFVEFSDDFECWALFWGPPGGEG